MTEKYQLAVLLDELKQLYRRIMTIALKRRVDSYRENASGGNETIEVSLDDRISRLSESKEGGRTTDEVAASADETTTDGEGPTTPRPRYKKPQGPFVIRLLKGFPQYLKKQRKGHSLQPHLSQQLQDSTWDHLHTAIRLARTGDRTNAKLHEDIALSALDELGHYMPEMEYKLFQDELQDEISEIKRLSDAKG